MHEIFQNLEICSLTIKTVILSQINQIKLKKKVT